MINNAIFQESDRLIITKCIFQESDRLIITKVNIIDKSMYYFSTENNYILHTENNLPIDIANAI